MNQQDRDHLRRNYMELLDGLKAAIDDVCLYLWKNKIITGHMREDIIEGKNTNRKRAMALLDLLPTRGPYAFDFLYAAAIENELFDVADILKPDRAPHHSSTGPSLSLDPTEEPLPDSWPSEKALENMSEKIRIATAEDKQICQIYTKHLEAGQESVYPMKRQLRGRCLIINNEEFVGTLPNREGSQKDKKSLQGLFHKFGFDVFSRNDQTNSKMWELLQKEAKDPIHQDADCFILVILSHGEEGVVFGTDGRNVNGQLENCTKIKDIRNLFCRVPALHGKPKLFFIQACQGRLKDGGQTQGGESKKDSSEQQVDLGSTKNLDVQGDAVDAVAEKQGTQADVFVAMSTVADHISWRNTKHGTWFIQAVVYVLAHYGYKYDLNGLMTLVNRLVGKAETKPERYKQVCESTTTLLKTFYFFPGLHMDQPF